MNYRLKILMLAVMCGMGVNAQDNRKVVVNETWNSTGNTKKMCYFYGADNQLDRSRNYKRDESGTGWTLVDYTVNVRDEERKLTASYTQSYRMIGGELTPSNISNKYAYEYNVQGQLTKITYPYGETCTRTYDEAGRYVQGDSVNGKNIFTIVNEYDDAGQLTSTTCSSTTSTYASANYTTSYSYDEQRRVTREAKISTTPSTSYSTNWIKNFYYNEKGWLDHVEQYVLNADGSPNYVKYQTEYTYEDNGTEMRATEKKLSHAAASSTSWTQPTTWNVYVYGAVDASTYSPVLSVATGNELGTATVLTISLPDPSQRPTLHIYRNGFEIGSGMTFAPGEDGTMQYLDEGLSVGDYEYFVEWENHNISNIVEYDLHIPLPGVQNLRVTNIRKDESVTDGETSVIYYATIEWDAPEATDKAELLGYDVYKNNGRAAENISRGEDGTMKDPDSGSTVEVDGTADRKFEVALTDNDFDNIYVVAVYDIAKERSAALRVFKPMLADVNKDGLENLNDVKSLVNMLLGVEELTDTADVDGNGKVDLTDLSKLIELLK